MSLEVDRLEAWLDDQEGIAGRLVLRRAYLPFLVMAVGMPFVSRDTPGGQVLLLAVAGVAALSVLFVVHGPVQVVGRLAPKARARLIELLSKRSTRELIEGFDELGQQSRFASMFVFRSRAVRGDAMARSFLLNQPWDTQPDTPFVEIDTATAIELQQTRAAVGGRYSRLAASLGIAGTLLAALGLGAGFVVDLAMIRGTHYPGADRVTIGVALSGMAIAALSLTFLFAHETIAIRRREKLTKSQRLTAWVFGEDGEMPIVSPGESEALLASFGARFVPTAVKRRKFFEEVWPLYRAEDRLPV